MHLKQRIFTYSAYGPITKKWRKNLKIMQKVDISTKMRVTKPVFNMIWLMAAIKIWLKNRIRKMFEK